MRHDQSNALGREEEGTGRLAVRGSLVVLTWKSMTAPHMHVKGKVKLLLRGCGGRLAPAVVEIVPVLGGKEALPWLARIESDATTALADLRARFFHLRFHYTHVYDATCMVSSPCEAISGSFIPTGLERNTNLSLDRPPPPPAPTRPKGMTRATDLSETGC